MNPVRFLKRLIGGLSLNAGINDVAPTDYIDGYDIVDTNPKAPNEDGLLQPNSNNKLAYDLGEVERNFKTYRVTMDLTGLATCNIEFYTEIKSIDNILYGNVSYTSGDTAATLLAAIQSALPTATITSVTVDGFNLVFDFSTDDYSYSDYFLTVVNSLGGTYQTDCIVDVVSPDKVGAIIPSRFENINNDQQIFATTNTKEPVTYLGTVSPSGTGLYIEFADDPAFEEGEEVYISPVSAGTNQVAGYFSVSLYATNIYYMEGTDTVAVTASGDYNVVRYARTLSIIGYAKKNSINDTWNYTELLRSINLNFRLYKQIQGALVPTSNGIIYNWTDYLNKLRRLIYKGDIIENGFLTAYNPDAIYELDTIGQESELQLGANTSKVTLSVATQAGVGGKIGYTAGSKSTACYAAFVRFKTVDGAYTTYSKASNVLWLHGTDLFVNKYGNNSGRAIQIFIEQIPQDTYTAVQVGIIEFTASSWVGYSLPEITLNGETELYVGDSGFDRSAYVDFNDAAVLLETIPFVFENTRSILSYENYLLAGNAKLFQEYDLNDWAQTIALTVNFDLVTIATAAAATPIENNSTTIFLGVNDYARCTNEWMSYMPHDHYRFCIFIDWENGSPTSAYWINDVSFEPADTGLGDFPVNTAGGNLQYYRYFVEATGINLNYVLSDGKLLKDVVKDIRFGRALCNPQVYTTGFGMNVYDDGAGNDYVSGFVDGANVQVDTKLALYSPDFQNTANIFNFESGDYLMAGCIEEAQTTTISSNLGVSFIDDVITSPSIQVSIDKLENVASQNANNIALFTYSNSGTICIRDGAVIECDPLDTFLSGGKTGQYFYYIKPYGADGAYPLAPEQTRFFVIPQDQWFNKDTHDSSTVYKLYGGDAFPTVSSYKIAENTSSTTTNNAALMFYSYNRTNTGLRGGSFPYTTLATYLSNKFITDTYYELYPFDQYTYDACFTPRYIFQNQVAFNPNLVQYLNKFSSVYYSQAGIGSDLSGGNRIWLPLDMKDLEAKYGAIVDMQVLLGLSGTNILIVLQERRVTAQYFDNSANILSNTGQLLIGNGIKLEREGQNFSEYGTENKWSVIKGQSDTGKDILFWICLRKTALMRFGADGTSNIVGDLTYLLENRTVLGFNDGYNRDDAPALFNGIHAVWDNKRQECICTLRLYPKTIGWDERAELGEFKEDPTLKWGFEQFPVIYKSLINANVSTPPNNSWETISGYDSEYFEIVTFVWNERDNKFKTYRTFSPKIYGQFNDNYVSSHPVYGNLIYEHNNVNGEALYYGVKTTTSVTATTDPTLYRITGTGIQSTFPSPFSPNAREKYVVTINGKNFEVVGTGTNYLQMASVDSDDILPLTTIPNFSYTVYNSQDPYIQGVCNNKEARYFHYVQKNLQCNDALKRTEYEAGYDGQGTPLTQSFNNKAEEEFYNGQYQVQIKMDTTNNPTDNDAGESVVEGQWLKHKHIFRWGKNNKVQTIEIRALETQKTK